MNLLKDLPKDKLQKIGLIAMVTIMIVAGVYQFYVSPRLATMATSKKAVEELTVKVADAEKCVKDTTANAAVRDSMQTFVKSQEPLMVTGDSFSWACREISLLAEKHPVRVVSLRPGPTAQHPRVGRYQTFTTKLEISGGYDELGGFIRGLENKFPAGEIRSLHISGTDAAARELMASVELVLMVKPEAGKEKQS